MLDCYNGSVESGDGSIIISLQLNDNLTILVVHPLGKCMTAGFMCLKSSQINIYRITLCWKSITIQRSNRIAKNTDRMQSIWTSKSRMSHQHKLLISVFRKGNYLLMKNVHFPFLNV